MVYSLTSRSDPGEFYLKYLCENVAQNKSIGSLLAISYYVVACLYGNMYHKFLQYDSLNYVAKSFDVDEGA